MQKQMKVLGKNVLTRKNETNSPRLQKSTFLAYCQRTTKWRHPREVENHKLSLHMKRFRACKDFRLSGAYEKKKDCEGVEKKEERREGEREKKSQSKEKVRTKELRELQLSQN